MPWTARRFFVIAPGTGVPDPTNEARDLRVHRIRATQEGQAFSTALLSVTVKIGGDTLNLSIPTGQARDIAPFNGGDLYGLSASSSVAGNILLELEGEWIQ